MLYLDSYGVEVSTGSACTTGMPDPSHVLMAIGRTESQAKSSIRVTLGKYTSQAELNYTVQILSKLINQMRKIKQ